MGETIAVIVSGIVTHRTRAFALVALPAALLVAVGIARSGPAAIYPHTFVDQLAGDIAGAIVTADGVYVAQGARVVRLDLGSMDVLDQSAVLPGVVNGLVAIDGYIAATAANRLLVLARTPGLPIRASVTVPGAGLVALDGSAVVVTSDSENGSVVIVDVTNPLLPVVMGSVSLPAEPNFVTAADGRAYVTYGYELLDVVTTADRRHPRLVGRILIPDSYDSQALASHSHYVYMADYSFGLRVVDVRDATRPRQVAAVEEDGATGVAVAGTRLFALWDRPGEESLLRVYDIATPYAPQLIEESAVDFGWGLAAHGDVAVTLAPGVGASGLSVPGLSRIGSYATQADIMVTQGGNLIWTVGGAGTFSMVAGGPSLTVAPWESDLPGRPAGSVRIPGEPRDVEAAGDLAVVAVRTGGVVVASSDGTGPPRVESVVRTRGQAMAVAFHPPLVYVADGRAGLTILDATDPAAPALKSTLGLEGSAHSIAVDGSLVFLLTDFGLEFVDASDPALPRAVGSMGAPDGYYGYPGPEGLKSLVAADGVVYLTTGRGVTVIDVANSARPSVVAKIAVEGGADEVVRSGDLLFVTSTERRSQRAVSVVGVGVPTQPEMLGEIPTIFGSDGARAAYCGETCTTSGWSVATRGEYLLVAGGAAGVGIYRYGVGQPATPTWTPLPSPTPSPLATARPTASPRGPGPQYSLLLPVAVRQALAPVETHLRFVVEDQLDLSEYSYGIGCLDWDGDRAVVGSSQGSLVVLDTSTVGELRVAGEVEMHWSCGLDLEDSTVVVASNDIVVVDARSPFAPTVMATVPADSHRAAVSVAEGVAYVGTRQSGLQTLELLAEGGPRTAGLMPVPGEIADVAAVGRSAYLLEEGLNSRLTVVDAALPAAPVESGGLHFAGSPVRVRLVGRDIALVLLRARWGEEDARLAAAGLDPDPSADTHSALIAVDLRASDGLAVLGRLNVPGTAFDMSVTGSTAYIATTVGIVAVDIAQPDLMRVNGRYEMVEMPGAIAAFEDRILVSQGSELLAIRVER